MKCSRAEEYKRPVDVESKNSSICWHCAKSVTSGCSWAKSFVPVEGWNAVERYIHTQGEEYIESYQVVECPLFERG